MSVEQIEGERDFGRVSVDEIERWQKTNTH